jgi:hypothetical protein
MSGITTTVTGTFTQRGSLRVTTSPSAARTIQVDSVPPNDYSVATEFPSGTHTVCYRTSHRLCYRLRRATRPSLPQGQTAVTGMFH